MDIRVKTKIRLKRSKLVRDYGINPCNMLRRAFADKPQADGTPLAGGTKGNPVVAEQLQQDFEVVSESTENIDTFAVTLGEVAGNYGIEMNTHTGVPLVNWDSAEPGRLDVSYSSGPSAYHEMSHACQTVIGGATALGSYAAKKSADAQGREAKNTDELKPFLEDLTPKEKETALATYVKPMESLAYAKFEETAFFATGMMGKLSEDQVQYKAKLEDVSSSFIDAYKDAKVPDMETNRESRVYGGIGHIARTNGETAALLGGAGVAYHFLAKQAMRIPPLMAIPAAAPLAYLLYRATVKG